MLGPVAIAALPVRPFAEVVRGAAPIVVVSTGVTILGTAVRWLRQPGIEFVAPDALREFLSDAVSPGAARAPAALERLLRQMARASGDHRGLSVTVSKLPPEFATALHALPGVRDLAHVGAWHEALGITGTRLYSICRRATGLSKKDILAEYLSQVVADLRASGATWQRCAELVGHADPKGVRDTVTRVAARRNAREAARRRARSPASGHPKRPTPHRAPKSTGPGR